MSNTNTPTKAGHKQWEVAFDETIQMWVVFFNQDRPDSLGERDFETGEILSPIMCDQIEIGRYHTEAIARLIASAPELKAENEQLKVQAEIDNDRINDRDVLIDQLETLNAQLLEALKDAEQVIWMYKGDILKLGHNVNDQYNKIKAAISKAEGKE